MFEKENLPLAIILLTTIYTAVTVDSLKLLDAVSDVKVDTHAGCHDQGMEKLMHSDLLRQELNKSEGFQKAWKAGAACPSPIEGGTREHTAALSAYYNADVDFKRMFDTQLEMMGVNVSIYENDFHFKSLYFLLMDALMLQKPEACKTAYALLDKMPELPKLGSTVRFSSFLTADSKFSNLEDADSAAILNITSCFYSNMGKNICQRDIGEILLSPGEYFTVDSIAKKRDPDDAEYTEVVLQHFALNHNHNCFMFSRSAAIVSTQSLFPLLMVLSLYSASF